MTTTQEPLAVVRMEESDLPLLQRFYRTHFPEKPKLNNLDLWRWEFLENPQNLDGAAFFVLRGEEELKGAIGGIRTNIQVGLRQLPACHPVDFFVAPDSKGFPALRLFRRILEDVPVYYASYVSADAAKLFEKAGFLNLNDDLRLYHYMLRPSQLGSHPGRYFRSLAVYMARQTLRLGLTAKVHLFRRGRYAYQVSDQLLESLVPAFDVGHSPNRIGLIKDFSYLAWRYGKSLTLRCRYFSQRKNGTSNCLVVVHEQPESGSVIIMDVVRGSADMEEVGSVLLKVIAHYSGGGYRMISLTCLNKELDQVLANIGFGSQPSNYRFMFYARDKELKNRLNDPARWDFNLGDTDVYQ